MSYVATKFPLPSVTGRNGAVLPFTISPAGCRMNVKRGTQTIRRAAPRPRLVLVPKAGPQYLGGFWSGTVKAFEGAVKGFAAGGPAGAIAGAVGGRIQDAQDDKAKKAAAAQQTAAAQQSGVASSGLGPLASVSTSTLVVGALSFSALILVLASRR